MINIARTITECHRTNHHQVVLIGISADLIFKKGDNDHETFNFSLHMSHEQ